MNAGTLVLKGVLVQAVVFHGVGDIRLEDVREPRIQESTDAIVRITASAICGTDLHMVRGTMPGMKAGTILGHEGVGTVEEAGPRVHNLKAGDRVIIPSTIGCGYCAYCRDGYFAQCDNANPNGPRAGTAFFGGPAESGPFHGLQAEYARVPYANVGCVKIPDDVTDDQAILLSDIFPTAYFGAKLAEIKKGDVVAIFGLGPVGQFTIASARMLGASRVLGVDTIPSRLDMARDQGAEVIDFNRHDPVEAIRELTGGIGPDRVIDAVGVDAVAPRSGPAAKALSKRAKEFRRELEEIAPKVRPREGNWHAGDAPTLALEWAVEACAKAGTIAVIGVYPKTVRTFPVGAAMMKNLSVLMGNCNHRKYIPDLVEMVRTHAIDPGRILTHKEAFTNVIDAYKAFDRREPGWVKVELKPRAMHA